MSTAELAEELRLVEENLTRLGQPIRTDGSRE
jgi:hypothetical protein